jgi:hypothetical protein
MVGRAVSAAAGVTGPGAVGQPFGWGLSVIAIADNLPESLRG